MVILACTVLIQLQSAMDRGRVTDTHSKTDASMTANMREVLHTVAREKSCAFLNFACYDWLVCIVACSRKKSPSLSLVLFPLLLTDLGVTQMGYVRTQPVPARLSSLSLNFDFLHSSSLLYGGFKFGYSFQTHYYFIACYTLLSR